MAETTAPNKLEDIRAYQKRIALLEAENARLRGFIDIGRTLGTEHRFEKLIPLIIEKISLYLNCERSTLFMLDWQKGQLWSQYAQGLTSHKVTIELKIGLAGASFLSNRIINVSDAYEHQMFNPYFDQTTGFRTRSVLCIPLCTDRRPPFALLQLLNRTTGSFTQDDERFLMNSIPTIMRHIDPPQVAEPTSVKEWMQQLRKTVDFERGTLFLHNTENNTLCSVYAEGLDQGQTICLDLNLGIAGHVAVTGTSMNIPDAYADTRFDRRTDDRTGFHTRNILCVPVSNQRGAILGVLQAINKKNGSFTDSDLNLLTSMASIISISVENAILFSEQLSQFKSLLQVMAASIDAKDTLTAGHSEMVEKLSIAIGRTLGFDDEQLDILSVAALLHDYGKIGIDDYILKKPGKLTPEEYTQIQKHVDITYRILSKMHFARKYRKVPIIAASHHERLDGSGYSHGVLEPDIPLMSKIIAVADVYEALTANRHYRNAMPPEKAFDILKEEVAKGKLDGQIVATLERCIFQQAGSGSQLP
ncbi:MAG: HD domain-containing phosphohydrolase [Thermodesulfobacteriota bacterium]